MEYIEHITLDGDRWDQIATLYYGDASRISPLAEANEHLRLLPVLPGGLPVRVRLGIRSNDGSIVEGTLALNEDCQFYPSDAALASWTALLPQGQVHVVYSSN